MSDERDFGIAAYFTIKDYKTCGYLRIGSILSPAGCGWPAFTSLHLRPCFLADHDNWQTHLWLLPVQQSDRHHFVPKLLLRPWLVEQDGQRNLHGYWWNTKTHNQKLACKKRGLEAFCFKLDLLSLRAHKLGRDAIERVFFGEIDRKGAQARDLLLENGPAKLSSERRVDFARLLLSLEARRPATVKRVRTDGRDYFAKELNTDRQILAAMAEHGVVETPSDYVENVLGVSLEDKALAGIQRLIDNPAVGNVLINAHWDLKKLGLSDGSFVLSDRPLIRIHGYNSPGATWVLPLTPEVAFFAVNHAANLAKLRSVPAHRFAKETNKSSALQTECFVFSADLHHEVWLGKYLRQKTRATAAPDGGGEPCGSKSGVRHHGGPTSSSLRPKSWRPG